MATSTAHFIVETKLAELRGQRDELARSYDWIEAQAAEGDAVDRVRALHEGLARLTRAGEPLHPDLPDLDALWRARHAGFDVDVEPWEARLRRELAHGRARSEVTYVFGTILEELASEVAPPPDPPDDFLVNQAATPEPLDLSGLRDELVALGLDVRAKEIREAFGDSFHLVSSDDDPPPDTAPGPRLALDVVGPLRRLRSDPERSAAVRAEAAALVPDDELAAVRSPTLRALRDAFVLRLTEAPRGWRWPAEGVEVHGVQTADRTRFHPDARLLDVIAFETVGGWFEGVLGDFLWSVHANRRRRLARLVELGAPEIIIENEREMLARPLGLLNDPAVVDEAVHHGSVVVERDLARGQLAAEGCSPGSYGAGYGEGSAAVVRLVDAELATRMAVNPERPVHVVKTDVRDCFASIRHDVVDVVLDVIGVPAQWREWVGEFLRVPWQTSNGIIEAQRGVPLNFLLSRRLADLVLGTAELQLRRRHPNVFVMRVVDDFTLIGHGAEEIAAAFAELEATLRRLGLGLNEAKTGSASRGEPAPEGIAAGSVRWNLLELGPGLTWELSETGYTELRDQVRADLEGSSLVTALRRYGDHARFVMSSLVARANLHRGGAAAHRRRVAQTLTRLEAEVVPNGLHAWLDRALAERGADTLPRAYRHWPITAGGLGLIDLRIALGQLQPTEPKEVPGQASPEWERNSPEWGDYYRTIDEGADVTEPRQSAIMETLSKIFIDRGKRLSGGAQIGLTPYWRWVLTLHGPSILDAFGTYTFLDERLVPLEIVLAKTGSEAAEPR